MSIKSTDDKLTINTDDHSSDTLTSIADSITDLVTGTNIPAPIRKNALKAFNQLCIAAIDIPVAYLEGVAAEKRAESQSRIKIISTGGDQIAKQMDVNPEFAKVAVKKYGEKILREQVNLNSIAEIAASQLQKNTLSIEKDATNANEIPEINDDWLNSFEKEACLKSTDEMRQLFGRILAGEIRKPTSFSIKTIKLIAQLDSRVVNLFRILCSLTVSLHVQNHIHDARVVAIAGNANSNSLKIYGLSYDNLNTLHEYGLIIPDYNSQMDYEISIARQNNVDLPFHYQNKVWGLVSTTERPIVSNLALYGVALSKSGSELLRIVDIEAAETYTLALNEYFKSRNLRMEEIDGTT